MEQKFNLSAMTDDVKDVLSSAKELGAGKGIINGLQTAIEVMAELESLVQTPAHEKRVKADLDKLIEELKECVKEGQENLLLGKVRTLRDRVNVLKAILSRGK